MIDKLMAIIEQAEKEIMYANAKIEVAKMLLDSCEEEKPVEEKVEEKVAVEENIVDGIA